MGKLLDMNQILKGKTAIITGASYGMGRTFAQVFAEQGANVVMTARGKATLDEAVEEIRKAGGSAIGLVADSRTTADCKKVFAAAIEAFGQVDILVNNAAKGEVIAIDSVTDELMDDVIDTNLKGPIIYCREAVNYMLPRGKGVIVNVSSVNGVRPMCGACYTSSKGAVNTLTQNLAIRLVGTGVRVNALCPGYTETPTALAHKAGTSYPEGSVTMMPILEKRTIRTVPTQAMDQAKACLFLASDLSSAVHGQILVVDNGSYL